MLLLLFWNLATILGFSLAVESNLKSKKSTSCGALLLLPSKLSVIHVSLYDHLYMILPANNRISVNLLHDYFQYIYRYTCIKCKCTYKSNIHSYVHTDLPLLEKLFESKGHGPVGRSWQSSWSNFVKTNREKRLEGLGDLCEKLVILKSVEKLNFGNPFHEKDEKALVVVGIMTGPQHWVDEMESFDDGTRKYKTPPGKNTVLTVSLFWVLSAFRPPEVYSSQGRQAYFLMDGTRLCSIEVYDLANPIWHLWFQQLQQEIWFISSSLHVWFREEWFLELLSSRLLLSQKISPNYHATQKQMVGQWCPLSVLSFWSHFIGFRGLGHVAVTQND